MHVVHAQDPCGCHSVYHSNHLARGWARFSLQLVSDKPAARLCERRRPSLLDKSQRSPPVNN
eukprot:2326660-Amphidinium_carterae.1